MTLPPVVRIFFAIDLPAEIKEKLGQFISKVKKKSKTHAIRWTKPENLHITLQFLPEVRAEHLTTLTVNVRTALKGMLKNSTFNFGSLHLFPNPYRPRVIVLDILPQDDLSALSKGIKEGIVASSYPTEDRPFRAHLTIGRIKQPQEINLNFLAEFSAPEIEKIAVDEVILFRSEPQPEGSRYSVLERIAF